MENSEHASDCPLLILGAGPAGYTAAIYAARAGLEPVLIAGSAPGGQLMTTTDVDNWPGEPEGIQGPDLMERMRKQAERFGTRLIYDQVIHADLGSTPFVLEGESGRYSCRALIIATGANARYLGLPAEKQFMGKGVSACATCDGFFFRQQDVAVIGGGNTAVEEALYLSNICRSVTLIHRRDQLRAEKILADRLMERVKNGNARVIWNHVVDDILGDDDEVKALRLRHTLDDRITELPVNGVFIAIGHDPNTSVFKGQLEMDKPGYIQIGQDPSYTTSTSCHGVYAAGDVADSVYHQAITSAGTGCMAALDADRYLDGLRST